MNARLKTLEKELPPQYPFLHTIRDGKSRRISRSTFEAMRRTRARLLRAGISRALSKGDRAFSGPAAADWNWRT